MSGTTIQLFVALAACMTGISGGFHVGWPSPSLVKLQAQDSDLPITSNQGSWLVSVFSIGNAVGGVIGGSVINKSGRKLTLILTAIPYTLACILIGAAQDFWWLMIARFIAALGVGAAGATLPMYLGEIADDKVRGGLVILINITSDIGALVAYSIGPWVSRVFLAGVGLSLPIILVLAFSWMPESPYFLMMKNRTDGAEKSLAFLRGTSGVKEELKKVKESIKAEGTGTIIELITTPTNRKAILILTLLLLAPQLSGYSAILAYSGLIFEASGSTLSTNISVLIVGVIQLLGGALSVFTVDLVGRRPLLMLSLFGSIVFVAGEALYFQLQANGTDVSPMSWLPVTAMVGYVISYALGLGCLPLVILSEIFPCNMKAVAGMYSFVISGLSAGLVSKLYQVIADAYGIHVPLWIFSGCSAASMISIYFILPETKQSSFRDIQDRLRATIDSKTEKP